MAQTEVAVTDGTAAAWTLGFGLVVLLLAAAAQAALIYIDRARLRHMLEDGTPRAQALAALLDRPSSTTATVLVVYTLAVAGVAASGFWLLQQWWAVAPWLSVLIGTLVLLALLFVQFLGRLYAVSQPERVALTFVRPLEVLGRVLLPVLLPLLALEQQAVRVLGLKRQTTPAEAEERLRHLVEDTTELEEDEREMIAGVIELGEQPVREVMVPRIDIKALPTTATVAEAVDRIVETGHSRIPVFQESIDNVTGIIYAKDVLRYLRDGAPDQPMNGLVREPYYVPDTKKVDELLEEMRHRRTHLAIVVDEYGGTAGLITIEDLIEEIVGEIHDEYDVDEIERIERISDDEALFDARVSIRDVNDVLDLDLDDDDFDTVGGLVYHNLGKVPVVGDEVQFDKCVVTVLSTTGRRVTKVRVARAQPKLRPQPAPTATDASA